MGWEVDNGVANLIALAGSVAVIFLWLSPVRDVWTGETSIWKTKSTKAINTAFGFVAGMIQCLLWNMYAVTRLDTMTVPFIVNTAGFILNSSFVACYWYFAEGTPKKEVRLQVLFLSSTIILAIIIWMSTNSNHLVGYLASCVNILMLFGPLAAAGQVVRLRSTRGMPLPPLVLTLISSTIWFCYGLYLGEVPVMIPNALGILFGIIQISLWFWARKQEVKAGVTVALNEDGFAPVTNGDALSNSGRILIEEIPIKTRDVIDTA